MANVGKIEFKLVQHNGNIYKIAPGQLKHYNRAFKRGKQPKIEDYGRLVGKYEGELHPSNCASCSCVDPRDTFHEKK
jgi:hypothetical protein